MATVPPFPLLPPQIAQQQFSQPPEAVFAEMGRQGGSMLPNPLDLLDQKITELEVWAGQMAPLLSQIQPGLTALLVPIAQAGKALQQEIGGMRERAAQGPTVQGSVPPSVPGVMPGARPVM